MDEQLVLINKINFGKVFIPLEYNDYEYNLTGKIDDKSDLNFNLLEKIDEHISLVEEVDELEPRYVPTTLALFEKDEYDSLVEWSKANRNIDFILEVNSYYGYTQNENGKLIAVAWGKSLEEIEKKLHLAHIENRCTFVIDCQYCFDE